MKPHSFAIFSEMSTLLTKLKRTLLLVVILICAPFSFSLAQSTEQESYIHSNDNTQSLKEQYIETALEVFRGERTSSDLRGAILKTATERNFEIINLDTLFYDVLWWGFDWSVDVELRDPAVKALCEMNLDNDKADLILGPLGSFESHLEETSNLRDIKKHIDSLKLLINCFDQLERSSKKSKDSNKPGFSQALLIDFLNLQFKKISQHNNIQIYFLGEILETTKLPKKEILAGVDLKSIKIKLKKTLEINEDSDSSKIIIESAFRLYWNLFLTTETNDKKISELLKILSAANNLDALIVPIMEQIFQTLNIKPGVAPETTKEVKKTFLKLFGDPELSDNLKMKILRFFSEFEKIDLFTQKEIDDTLLDIFKDESRSSVLRSSIFGVLSRSAAKSKNRELFDDINNAYKTSQFSVSHNLMGYYSTWRSLTAAFLDDTQLRNEIIQVFSNSSLSSKLRITFAQEVNHIVSILETDDPQLLQISEGLNSLMQSADGANDNMVLLYSMRRSLDEKSSDLFLTDIGTDIFDTNSSYFLNLEIENSTEKTTKSKELKMELLSIINDSSQIESEKVRALKNLEVGVTSPEELQVLEMALVTIFSDPTSSLTLKKEMWYVYDSNSFGSDESGFSKNLGQEFLLETFGPILTDPASSMDDRATAFAGFLGQVNLKDYEDPSFLIQLLTDYPNLKNEPVLQGNYDFINGIMRKEVIDPIDYAELHSKDNDGSSIIFNYLLDSNIDEKSWFSLLKLYCQFEVKDHQARTDQLSQMINWTTDENLSDEVRGYLFRCVGYGIKRLEPL